jgi:phosphohistidine phosphatase SixA
MSPRTSALASHPRAVRLAAAGAVRLAAAGAVLLAAAGAASARDGEGQALVPRLEGAALVEALQEGGYVILMRHMATEAVAPDPATFDLRDCSTQRNLSEEGRRDAELVHQAVEKLGIRIGEVLSSPYCRCLETARLAFGGAREDGVLTAFDQGSALEKDERGAAIRRMLGTKPAKAGTNTVLITHTGTLLYTFGLDTTPEGIAHVFRPGPAGIALYVGKLTPDEWSRAAGLAASPPE